MRLNICFGLLLIVATVAVPIYYFERQGGESGLAWMAVVLGGCVVGAIWLLPGDKQKDGKDE